MLRSFHIAITVPRYCQTSSVDQYLDSVAHGYLKFPHANRPKDSFPFKPIISDAQWYSYCSFCGSDFTEKYTGGRNNLNANIRT